MSISHIRARLRIVDVAAKAKREGRILKWIKGKGTMEIPMNIPEMACGDDEDWGAQQAQDEANEKRAVTQAYERIYRAVAELELLYNCGLPDLRADVRLTEMVLFRK